MIVHEAVPRGPTVSLDAVIEHDFVTSVDGLRAKVGRYALLWALRSALEGRRPRSPSAQWALHLLRDLVLRGAAFSGRPEAFQIASVMADYHAWKYALLREVLAGGFAGVMDLLRADRLEELFRALPDVEPGLEAWAPWATRHQPRVG
jgi:hypothetical protein